MKIGKSNSMGLFRIFSLISLLFFQLVLFEGNVVAAENGKWGFLNESHFDGRCPSDAKYSLSFHLGKAYAHSHLGEIAKDGQTLNLDALFPIDSRWSWDVRLGYSTFQGKSSLSDVEILNLSANIAYAVLLTKPWLFLNLGPGGYTIDDSNPKLGYNAGVGLGYAIDQTKVFEFTYNYHSTVNDSPKYKFSKLQIGLIWSF